MSSSAASHSGREASAANPPRRPPLLVRHPAAAARTLPPSSRRGYNLSPTPPTLAAEVPPQIEQPTVSPPAPAAAPSAIQRREGIQGLHAAQGLHGARAARLLEVRAEGPTGRGARLHFGKAWAEGQAAATASPPPR